MRCLEQIRNDICYHELDVKIVAVGGGVAYGPVGYTHHGVEDLAIMRAMPNMTVCAPGDPHETRSLTARLVERPGPAYLRLGKAGEPVVHPAPPDLVIGRALRLRKASDVALLSTGGTLDMVVAASDALTTSGISAGVWSFQHPRRSMTKP